MFETEFLIPQEPDISHELVLRKARIYDIIDQNSEALCRARQASPGLCRPPR